MKKVVFSFFLLFSIVMSYAAEPDSTGTRNNNFSEPIDRENCSCKGIPLYGDVMIVNGKADFQVEIVNGKADLNVEIVNSTPSKCGEWRFVTGKPDFTIEIVSGKPDFTIEYVSSFPGID